MTSRVGSWLATALLALWCSACVGGQSTDSEAGTDGTDGSEATEAECPPGCGTDAPFLQVGENTAASTDESAFRTFDDGDATVVFGGSNGFWMVVVAGRTNQLGCCVDRVDVETTAVRTDGMLIGQLKFKRRPVVVGADGNRYILNLFLAFPGTEDTWLDQTADITLKVTSSDGDGSDEVFEDTARVVLRRSR